MLFRLEYDEGLAQAAYLIGCQRTGEAIVFDPERDVDRYLDLAREHGLRIVAVAETHIHADFLSGARELADRAGAKVYVSGLGEDEWRSGWLDGLDHQELGDGDRFSVGNIDFTAVHTPGHTPEHISFSVTDRGSGADLAMGMITGDFVFVGDLGRPDLLESAAGVKGAMEPSARSLARSAKAFLSLDDHLQVWPAHGSGSACGKALGAVPQSTVGYERRFNSALSMADDEDAFVDHILAGQPEPPSYFARMKAWNRDGVPLLGELPKPRRVDASGIEQAIEGARIVDVRPWADFRNGHLRGSNWAMGGVGFLMAVGSYVQPGERIVLVCEEDRVEELVRLMVRIGLDDVEAFTTPADLERYARDGGTLDPAPEIDADAFVERLDGDDRHVLDVRRAVEHDAAALRGSINIAHTRLVSRIEEIPDQGELLVHCAGGIRSAAAAAELRRRGYDAVNVAGGWSAMTRSGCGSAVTAC